uniref:USP domain-containing protein n=1 Tax=Mastacembelus armatus TaxID=205130 RepID=A0A7N9B0T8_9TELE
MTVQSCRMFDILIILTELALVHRGKTGGLGPHLYFGTFEDEDMACAQLCAPVREPALIFYLFHYKDQQKQQLMSSHLDGHCSLYH